MRRGFTVVELMWVLVAAVIIAVVARVVMQPGRHGCTIVRDSSQLRGMTQSLAVWANSNNGNYLLPSELDVSDFTVPEPGRGKDTTANMLAALIWNGFISPELCISNAESSTGNIQMDEDYLYDLPTRAVTPASALWDPAFSADFTGTSISNNSYAYLQLSGSRGTAATGPTGRLKMWRDTFSSSEAIMGNRAPEIGAVKVVGKPGIAASYTPVIKNPASNTFLIHGGRRTWEGYIAFNDGSVRFETSLQPKQPSQMNPEPIYSTASGVRLDMLFFDEPDDVNESNVFLGIFTTAGEKPSEFKGIWD